ncbi:MAG: endonuclease/exonuclease/phosphatase family protein [Balneolaceae bacterium]|nr:endonuclease/exonuclease/phosphatase family protein [Balneolaceae bacterium]
MTVSCDDSPSSEVVVEPMRVMSFNIRFDNPDDGPNAWPHRKDFVASMFRFHQNDLVGTQEGLNNQLKELDEMLPEFDWVGIGRDAGDERGEFCAIYYRTERFDLLEDGTFWLSETPDEPGSQGWDAALPRIVTWARLFDKKNDRSFIVFNTHFDHRGQEARRKSSELILEKVAELADGDPVIVMGDLNAVEDQDPYRVLAEPDLGPVEIELFDGYYHSRFGHHGPTSTWNGFREIVPDRRIDYIFTDAGFSFVQHGILADIRDGHFPSDHLPVVADVKFTE